MKPNQNQESKTCPGDSSEQIIHALIQTERLMQEIDNIMTE